MKLCDSTERNTIITEEREDYELMKSKTVVLKMSNLYSLVTTTIDGFIIASLSEQKCSSSLCGCAGLAAGQMTTVDQQH